MKYIHLALPALLLPLLAQAQSNDDALKLEEMVITSGRNAEPLNQATAAATVFTRADIERLQPSSITELLTRVPGVQLVQNGGRGSNTSLFIRGSSNTQSLILVDGQRIGSASDGGASLQFLSLEQIERIEVVRGSRSALYGSDAIGGVVQIFTRRGSSGLQPRLAMSAGSDQSFQRSLGLSGGDEQTRFSLNGSLDETAGIDRTGPSYDSDSDHDAYRNKALSLNLSHQFSERLEGGVSLLDQRGRSEYDNPFGRFDMSTFLSYPQQPYTDFSLASGSAFIDAQFNDLWSSRWEVGHSESRQKSKDKLSDEVSVFNTYRDAFSWVNTLQLGEQNTLLAGLDWYEDKLHSSTEYDQQTRWNQAAFVQHRFQGEWFATELGLRHDDNQQFGSENTWNGALTVPLGATTSLIASYSEGFRAPTYNELYWPDDGNGYIGNPNLSPEHSKTYELQLRGEDWGTRWSLAAYRNEVRDLISTVLCDPATYLYCAVNLNKARLQGIELTLEREVFGWQASANASWLDARDRETGHALQRRAKRTLNLDIDRHFGKLGVGVSWQAFSSSYDDVGNTRELPGYGLVGLRSSWQASSELEVQFKVDNLLNQDYSRAMYSHDGEYYDYREAGRTASVGFVWTPAI
ncbi:TonB-dependent receptor domain-containing protein [Pseudomonas sp. GV071]|uniref:TonB-dependent receptor domain-containing protein n=1 Tax=Pseudomonas sp. GV071 TaxID=2135754 RepID=UPI000D3854C3|nr:TonB-dependent receptor [Pseudomonas sp. GV071]PTQ70973.1 vitamin B12 transporter [Pseudomonas sp. GV071]